MKKNNKGFTLVELLVSLAVLGIVLLIGIHAARGTAAAAVIGIKNVGDEDIFMAAKRYVTNENISMKKGYTCMYVQDLVDHGYLVNPSDSEISSRLVKVSRNNVTKTISSIKYVDKCDS